MGIPGAVKKIEVAKTNFSSEKEIAILIEDINQ
jgi:hypothetical protein